MCSLICGGQFPLYYLSTVKERSIGKRNNINLVKILLLFFFSFHLLVQMNHPLSLNSANQQLYIRLDPFSSVELDIWYMYVPNNIR